MIEEPHKGCAWEKAFWLLDGVTGDGLAGLE